MFFQKILINLVIFGHYNREYIRLIYQKLQLKTLHKFLYITIIASKP